MIDIDVCSLERRVSVLEQEHREAASSRACITLSELQAQVNAIKQKLETIEHLSWLGKFTQSSHKIYITLEKKLKFISPKILQLFISIVPFFFVAIQGMNFQKRNIYIYKMYVENFA